ncbi:MAG: AAA family ATPase [Oscillospiraceae bacterium]|nr:AAA family ATPase [Oscillospiraceae bacterium]
MGLYFNPQNYDFAKCLRSEIYVDKSGIISYTNKVFNTLQCYICVSRPRRFGKTITAAMLNAYYNRDYKSEEMFENLKISKDVTFKTHLNKYDVIYLNIQDFLSESTTVNEMIKNINESIADDILEIYPKLNKYISKGKYIAALNSLFIITKTPITFIIDEWDCVFREYKSDTNAQKVYLDFLRTLLKDKQYVGLAYMTGILPIKKIGSHSALNMFNEFSMSDPRELAEFVGFTQNEVISLCKRYKMGYEEISRWYNGYNFPRVKSIYKNDMVTFKTNDDILTLLIHLGYLGYDLEKKEVFIPNKEIRDEFVTAIRDTDWNEIINAIQ